MSRPHPLIGPVIFLAGSLGLAMYGAALAGCLGTVVFEYAPGLASLASLSVAMGSLALVAVGLVLARVSHLPASGQSTTVVLVAAVAAILCAVGAFLYVWSIGWNVRGLDALLSADTSPTSEKVDFATGLAEPSRMLGSALLLLSAALAIGANCVKLGDLPAVADFGGDTVDSVLRWVSVGVGMIVVLLAAFAWLYGRMLSGQLTAPVFPSPNQIAGQLKMIHSASWYAFSGLCLFGVLDLVASLRSRHRPS